MREFGWDDMEVLVAYLFRAIMYCLLGFSLEIVYSAIFVEKTLGVKVQRRVPYKYLEGFVSLYMIPIYALGLLFLFEPLRDATRHLFFGIRFVIWALGIGGAEALSAFVMDKVFGFYPWDYYKDSPYKVFKRGYTLYTLLPLWGLAGFLFEFYSDLLRAVSDQVVSFVLNL
jgi:hypothetical protein